ncbi:MAG: nitroreductase family protein [Anaerohalosphaeraceae bacterium]
MLDVLRTRRSIRKYKSAPITPEQIDLLKEAILRSPSSRGLDPWEFIFVEDKVLLEQLSGAKQHGAEFVKNASLAVVICADPDACDVWIEDCSIASIITHLAAHNLGLGSCWVQIRLRQTADGTDSEARVRQILGIPDPIRILSMVAIGQPDQKLRPVPKDKLKYKKIHTDRW